jgi:hypothetical protein
MSKHLNCEHFKKIYKSRKITNFERFAYGPTKPSLRLCQISVLKDPGKLFIKKKKFWLSSKGGFLGPGKFLVASESRISIYIENKKFQNFFNFVRKLQKHQNLKKLTFWKLIHLH